MDHQNRYCTRCNQTTRFKVEGQRFTCTRCHAVTERVGGQEQEGDKRVLVGDPFHNFRLGYT